MSAPSQASRLGSSGTEAASVGVVGGGPRHQLIEEKGRLQIHGVPVHSPSQRAMRLRWMSEVPEYRTLPTESRSMRSISYSAM